MSGPVINPYAYGGGGSPTLNLDGHTVTKAKINQSCWAGVEVLSNGTVKAVGATSSGRTQIDGATDWVIPNSAAPDDYEVHCHLDSGSALTSSDAQDTWLPLTTTRKWQIKRGSEGIGTAQITIGIRKGNSGAATVSGIYPLSAQYIVL
ncbi:hypothetical protein JYU02_00150 [bacterium AH-315-P15]|nr:hypothetical protein [bacterium AH-315-P15]